MIAECGQFDANFTDEFKKVFLSVDLDGNPIDGKILFVFHIMPP